MSDRDSGFDLTMHDYARLTAPDDHGLELFGPENYEEKEGRPKNLEGRIITPPPDNPPPGVMGDRPRQSTIRQGLGRQSFEPTPDQLIELVGLRELHTKMHATMDAILEALREQDRPPIFTASFRAVFAGGAAAWLGPLIPPQPGAALYVTSIWGNNQTNVNAAFGQGQSSADAEFFVSNVDAGGDLALMNNKTFTLTNDFPDWVFRCDPGKGLMVHAAGNCTIDGYLQWFARPLSEDKYR